MEFLGFVDCDRIENCVPGSRPVVAKVGGKGDGREAPKEEARIGDRMRA